MESGQSSSALPPGTRLDRYTIQSILGAGGFGITYLAEHELLKKCYAIKEHFPSQFATRDLTTGHLVPSDLSIYKWALDKFLQEARILTRCSHPNIVRVTDIIEANKTGYMVLEYEGGQNLETWLKSLGRRPTQREIDNLLTPLLAALGFIHSQGLLHRDIAPDNILLRDTDRSPCLIDFGAARDQTAERSRASSAVVKTGYSPPEQYAVGAAQGPWTDIYALAATLHFALSGKAPPDEV